MIEILRSYQQNYINNLEVNYQRYFHKEVDFDNKLIGIVGARGVGKTTFLLQYLKKTDIPFAKKLYFSADAIDVDSIFDIAYEFHKIGGKLLVIDEIHKYKGFELELKKIYDMLSLKVIFSGSSAIKLDHSKGDLSRRAILYNMKGLSFREFLEIKQNIALPSYSIDEILKKHSDISAELLSKFKPYEHWEEYLKYGFYPFYFENKNTYQLKLKETINTVIEVDIPSIFKIDYDKIINLKKLVRLICESKPFKVNIKELSFKIGVSDYQTLYKYLEYLRRGKILNILKQKTKGDLIFSKPDKLYLSNTNLHFSYCTNSELGTTREVFFSSQFDDERLSSSQNGDFIVDEKYIFEVGGKNKKFKHAGAKRLNPAVKRGHIKDIENSYVVADDIEIGCGNKVPLWLFGFLY